MFKKYENLGDVRLFYKMILTASLVLAALCYGQENSNEYFVTLSTSKCRTVAMGGAFMAVNDDLATAGYNPAALDLYRNTKNFKITFFLNPLTSIASLTENCKNEPGKNTNVGDILWSVGLALKGIAFSFKYLEGGFIISEESLNNSARLRRKKFMDFDQFRNDFSNSFIMRFRLAPQVAVGINTTIYNIKGITKHNWDFGTSYGVLLKPNEKINVGVVYIGLSKKIPEYREPIEKISDDTINLGLAYQPNAATTLSLDVRELNKIENSETLEIHSGLEQVCFSILALRTGYFRSNSKHHYFSMGFGLLDNNNFINAKNRFGHKQFIINYSMVLESFRKQVNKWHFFSFVFRI